MLDIIRSGRYLRRHEVVYDGRAKGVCGCDS
jgi:hypothetical protein